jgi:hypothetical protein
VRHDDPAEGDDRDLASPAPMSMIMFPDGPLIGTLAPIAAASGSSIR